MICISYTSLTLITFVVTRNDEDLVRPKVGDERGVLYIGVKIYCRIENVIYASIEMRHSVFDDNSRFPYGYDSRVMSK